MERKQPNKVIQLFRGFLQGQGKKLDDKEFPIKKRTEIEKLVQQIRKVLVRNGMGQEATRWILWSKIANKNTIREIVNLFSNGKIDALESYKRLLNSLTSFIEKLGPDIIEMIMQWLSLEDAKVFCSASPVIKDICDSRDIIKKIRQSIPRAYMFGEGLYGRLGDGFKRKGSVTFPRRIATERPIKMISCGTVHTALLTESGIAFTFGLAKDGRLGIGEIDKRSVSTPKRVLYRKPIKTISCGYNHTAFVSNDGDAYAFGNGEHGCLGDYTVEFHIAKRPQLIPFDEKVRTITCGHYCTALVSESKKPYTFGLGNYGKLGDGDTSYHFVGFPTLIDLEEDIKNISCGKDHTAFLTEDGKAYMCGNGTFGQLGIAGRTDRSVGTPIVIIFPQPIKVISCGSTHTAFVTENGEGYAFGLGEYGVLGDGKPGFNVVSDPTRILFPGSIETISCGNEHTMFISTDGHVYGSGNGVGGRLGDKISKPHFVSVPKRIMFPYPVESISCGTEHTGFVTKAIPYNPGRIQSQCMNCQDQVAKYVFKSKPVFQYCSHECASNHWNWMVSLPI